MLIRNIPYRSIRENELIIQYHVECIFTEVLLFTVPSQCVVTKTLNKKNTLISVATKILMQLNCKLGGELWRVHIPVSLICLILLTNFISQLLNFAMFVIIMSK